MPSKRNADLLWRSAAFCGHWGNEPRTSKTSPRSRIRRVGKGAFTPEVTGVTHDMYENTKTYSQLEGFL
jgi:hypothetical protein